MMQVVQILVIFLFFLFIFLIGVSRHFRVKIIISWLYTTMAPIFAAARESYLPESFRKVDDNNPFFSLSPPMLRVSEASLDIGLYSNNNLCNYVYVWVHALASLVSFLPSYACRANVSLSLSLSLFRDCCAFFPSSAKKERTFSLDCVDPVYYNRPTQTTQQQHIQVSHADIF
jgi:hypothetical protein